MTASRTAAATDASVVIDRRISQDEAKFTTTTLVAIAAMLAGLWFYWSVPDGEFVHDDARAIVNNPDVTGEGTTVWRLWLNDFWGEDIASADSHKSYRPLTVLTFRLVTYELISTLGWWMSIANEWMENGWWIDGERKVNEWRMDDGLTMDEFTGSGKVVSLWSWVQVPGWARLMTLEMRCIKHH